MPERPGARNWEYNGEQYRTPLTERISAAQLTEGQ